MGIRAGIVLRAMTCVVCTGTGSANADTRAGGDGGGPSVPAGLRSGPSPDRPVRSCGRCPRHRSGNAPRSPGSVKANDVVTGATVVTAGAHDACFEATDRRSGTTSH
ncbi:hypothetical protein [Streptomyces sp. HUAS TT11]|uniref:hypothetical protein n=1 Tax=Streptomyces sp. HUAS TT11 TaxID=3447508 RepID=UPI003F660440